MDSRIIIEKDFSDYKKLFLKENSKLNLISKNDEKLLFEKHIYDSLAIKLTGKIKDGQQILDIGCGGGFPCVPIAIEFPNINVTGVDSITKKIKAVNTIKSELNLNNLTLINDRVENITGIKFDIVTCRAVTKLTNIIKYAAPLLNNDGYIIAYKSRQTEEEIEDAKQNLNKYHLKIDNIIKYDLPLNENYTRTLIVIGI